MLLVLLALLTPPDCIPDALPDALPDARSSGTPAPAATTRTQAVLPVPDLGAIAASLAGMPPPAPPASPIAYVWGAKWCTWCHLMSPAVRQLQSEGWPIYEYDVDEHANMAAAWEAYVLPTVIVLRLDAGEGVALERVQAYQTYEQLKEMLRRNGVQRSVAGDPPSAGLLPNASPAQGSARRFDSEDDNRRKSCTTETAVKRRTATRLFS